MILGSFGYGISDCSGSQVIGQFTDVSWQLTSIRNLMGKMFRVKNKLISQRGEASTLLIVGFVLFLCLCAAWGIGWRPPMTLETRWPEGELVPIEPVQLSTNKKPWYQEKIKMIPLATFSLTARMLLNVSYGATGLQTDISPRDLVVGWRSMSDTKYIKQLVFSHSDRLVWVDSRNKSNWSQIGPNLSHIHAIPANEDIASIIAAFDTDDLIYLDGYLVSVEMEGFAPWTSSLTRFDNGCEIMWINQANLLVPKPSAFKYFLNPSSITNPKFIENGLFKF